MKRYVWPVSFLLMASVAPVGLVWAQEAVEQKKPEIVDNRDASFLPPPPELLSVDEAKPDEGEPKAEGKTEEAKPPAKEPVSPAPVVKEKPADKPAEKPPEKPVEKPAPIKPVAAPALPEKTPATPSVPKEKPAAAQPPEVLPQEAVLAVPAVQSPVPSAPVAQPEPAPVVIASPVAAAPLADVDPETLGLLSPSNGGLGATLWKDTSRALLDRLMPTIGLPSVSGTLNALARRMFLTTAAAPYIANGDAQPVRSFLAQRVEALMALGAVSEAWKLASLAQAKLVDPVTLRLLTEAAMIGPDSQEVCSKIPEMMAAHGKTAETGVEWQKSLLICQLRAKDMKAVQLGLDVMREQPTKDDIFLSLMNKNVLGEAKKLPGQLTPLRPLNLAVLRQLDLPLPSSLYARAEASMIPELLLTKAVDEEARLGLAEKAAARGIITAAQLTQAYQSLSLTPDDIAQANSVILASPRSRAMAYQAALNERAPLKKVELVQRVVSGIESSALTGPQGQIVAPILETIPVSNDFVAQSVTIARLFVLAGKPDKALPWLTMAREAARTSPDVAASLTDLWPLLTLSGLVPDGEYAQGLKVWLAASLKDNADIHVQRELVGRTLLLLNAAGYAIPEEAWLQVVEGSPVVKGPVPSPVLIERLKQVALSGRKGETILLSLLTTAVGSGTPPYALMTEIVRSLRLVGLTAEAQSMAREVLLGLKPN